VLGKELQLPFVFPCSFLIFDTLLRAPQHTLLEKKLFEAVYYIYKIHIACFIYFWKLQLFNFYL